ncbi:hypothetical protein BC830DRAFT_1180317 [Chytriomyces sp. MP71]|nr:hypothetical protein BC830DRAFT_1180317 [Chytriomyces sp. MP71]
MTYRATVAEQTARANGTWISDAELTTLEQDALVSWLQVGISEMETLEATYKRVARRMRIRLKLETKKRKARRRLQHSSVAGINMGSQEQSSHLLGSVEGSTRSGTATIIALVGQQSAARGVANSSDIHSEHDIPGPFPGTRRPVSPDSSGPRVWPPSEIIAQALWEPHTQINLNPAYHADDTLSSINLPSSSLQMRSLQVEGANLFQPLQLSHPLSPLAHPEFFPNAYFYASCITSSYLGFD